MTWRRAASRLLFGLGVLLASVGLLLLGLSGRPSGMEGLGQLVGGILLLAAASLPFALALLLGAGEIPRWMVALSVLGCLASLVPAGAFVLGGARGAMALGAVSALAALAGLALGGRAWRTAARA